jgi:hypothetical protein
MHDANMTKLAEVLRSPAAAKHFCLDVYFDDETEADSPVRELPFSQRIERCGAVACIAG